MIIAINIIMQLASIPYILFLLYLKNKSKTLDAIQYEKVIEIKSTQKIIFYPRHVKAIVKSVLGFFGVISGCFELLLYLVAS